MSRKRGKKIGKSILGQKSGTLKLRAPTPEEIDEIKKELEEEQRAEEKDAELEESGEKMLPKIPTPTDKEPEHGSKLPVSPKDIEQAIKQEEKLKEKEIKAKELRDKRLKKGKKVRVDIKEIQS